ncbi:MAG: hypothetical protein HPZ91_17370 [Lentisphaeria bacterium]|nr:hypothetical protein [Lentisphaeria bacterium]
MNRPNPRQQEEKKSPLGKIIVVLVILAVLGALAMVGLRIPDTMELERQMDAAASSISSDSVTMLAGAVEQHPQAANAEDAKQLVNEMIGVMIAEAVPKTDYRTLEGLGKELDGNTAWKPYATDANRKILADAWREVLRRMQEEQDRLTDLKAIAARLQNASIPQAADVAEFVDFKLPAGFAGNRPVQVAAAYAAAVTIKNQELADSVLAEAAGKEAVRAGTEEPCKECNSKGTVPCQSCTANPGKCPSCRGTGKMKANRLVGNKFESIEQPCTRCGGTGECAACKGTGKRECFYCKGTAKRTNTQLAAETMKKTLRTLTGRIDAQAAELNRLKSAVTP